MHFLSVASTFIFLVARVSSQVDGHSPPSYPSPWASGGLGWDEAYAKARAFVSQLTLPEKVNITTGTGWTQEQCVGNTGSIPRLGLRTICCQDSPLGIRFSKPFRIVLQIYSDVASRLQFCIPRRHQCCFNLEHQTLQISRSSHGRRAIR
jgi:hypothetical protein